MTELIMGPEEDIKKKNEIDMENEQKNNKDHIIQTILFYGSNFPTVLHRKNMYYKIIKNFAAYT